jgi:hypothetical protein
MWAKKVSKAMKTSSLSILLVVFGEVIIIAAFLFFGNPSEEKYLYMAVSSVIYLMWFWQTFVPWLNLKDKANRELGSLGIKWHGIIIYSIAAIAAMLYCSFSQDEVPFNAQLIIHAILFFILFAYLVLGKSAEDKVASVHKKETIITEKRDEIKTAINNLRRKLSVKNEFPHRILERIAKLEDEARYISPSNSLQAQNLDGSFAESLKKLETKLDFGNLEQIEIDELLKLCEITLAERRRVLN